jgi:HNH endonuclease
MSRVSGALFNRVRLRARDLCEYCRSNSDYTGHDFTVDHITPEAEGGTDDFENLCLCCFWCNSFKKVLTRHTDPRTKRRVLLFNPRLDSWHEHFRWSPTATRIIGRTAIGRATIVALRLNRLTLVRARRIWARHGLHPPS